MDGEGKAMHKSLGNAVSPTRSSRTTARTCSACGWPPPTTPRTCASPRTS
ncbi:hypothetical protein M5E87_08105 [Flavonifractor plautii]|nr:hypothetical protein M5E87_08105 [Flavonifractor plautii]